MNRTALGAVCAATFALASLAGIAACHHEAVPLDAPPPSGSVFVSPAAPTGIPTTSPYDAGITLPPVATAAVGPRCVRAGGTCVGMAAVRANPKAPCPAGMHKVTDVSALAGEEPAPLCMGTRTGEEACCMPAGR